MKISLTTLISLRWIFLVSVVVSLIALIGLSFYPKKCQEVKTYGRVGDVNMDIATYTHCYTVFDKKFWSIPRWSSINVKEE